MWLYVTEDRGAVDELLRSHLAPLLRGDVDELSEYLPIGPPEHGIGLMKAYRSADAQQILLWPIRDPIDQLHVFAEDVLAELG